MKYYLRDILISFIFFNQKIIFLISSIFTFFIPIKKTKDRIMVGRETANLLNLYSKLFNCYSINTDHNRFYDSRYSLDLSKYPKFLKFFILPLIFPFILKRFSSIWYFSSASFFVSRDGRNWEFKTAKKKNLSIICFFMGADIRSLKLAKKLSDSLGLDYWVNYIDSRQNRSIVENSDRRSMVYSGAADKYADHILGAEKDNISYIKKDIHMIPMPVSRNRFIIDQPKWNDLSTIKILHSPSSPITKGTQIVISVIKRLELEGYNFDFELLSGVSQAEVLIKLDDAHIALNEFYAYCPGLFGIEALEANCLLLTSASKDFEPTLFEGCNEAWVPTLYFQLFDNLKYYLDNLDLAKARANKGTIWAKKYCSHEASVNYINTLIGD